MREKLIYYIYGAAAISASVFVVFVWPHNSTWDGGGQINAFPSSDGVKNYRLDATMTVTRSWRGWFSIGGTITYSNITGSWPDGGSLELNGCVVTGTETQTCTDQSGKAYGIEISTAPVEPQTDTSSDLAP